jgi:hypothetical protein
MEAEAARHPKLRQQLLQIAQQYETLATMTESLR